MNSNLKYIFINFHFQDEEGGIAVQNDEATQQFPSYVMPEAGTEGVPMAEATKVGSL